MRRSGPSLRLGGEVGDDLVERAALPLPLYVVSVRAQREVSDAITRRFGIRHESPQVLLVHRGAVLWHASHFRVRAAEIQAAVERVAAPTTR